jgi:multiple sugar transport system permease protein
LATSVTRPIPASQPPQVRARRRPLGYRIGRIAAYTVLTVGAIIMMLPFLWLISSSLKRPEEIFLFPPQWIPNPVAWNNYPDLLTQVPMALYARNTMTIVAIALPGQVITASLCAYAFSRLRWPGRDVVFAVLLGTMMLPSTVTMIPIFIIFKTLGWLNSFYPLTVPAWFGGGAFNIFLLRQFFLTIPFELEEAARIDGAGTWRIWLKIILPLSRPALTVVTIFSFISHWNDFMGPLIYLNSTNNRTLMLGLNSLQGLEWGRDMTHQIMAFSAMMILPVIIIFFFAQRVFIQGIVLTGIKG